MILTLIPFPEDGAVNAIFVTDARGCLCLASPIRLFVASELQHGGYAKPYLSINF